jgi:hypothetical protein
MKRPFDLRLPAGLSAVLVASLAACGDGKNPTGSVDPVLFQMRAESTTVAVGHAARYFVPGGGVTAAAYSGAVGSATASFGRVNDSTLVLVVPEVAAGSATVTVDIGDRRGTSTQTITAGQSIANPAASIATALDAVATATVGAPKPAGYGSAWTSDSTYVAQQLAEARAKISQLSTAEQLEIARLLGETGLAGLHAARPNAASRNLGGTPEDIACIEQLIGWDNDNKAAETTAGVALAAGNSAVRAFILSAAALTTYLKGVMAYAGVKSICTMEQAFDITSTADAEGTSLDITADRFTVTDNDAEQNPLVKRLSNAKAKLIAIYELIKKAFAWITGAEEVSAPAELGASTLVAADVPVDADRVDLESSTVAATDGSQVSVSLLKRAGTQLVLKALSTVKSKFTTNVSFRVKRTEFADQVVTRPVNVEQVCYEGSLPSDVYFGSSCVGSVAVTPATTAALPVNGTVALSTKVTGVDGSTLTNRTIRWTSSDESVATVSASGVVTGVKVGGPVTITGSAGPVASPVSGSATVTVTQACTVDGIRGTHNATGAIALIDGQVLVAPLPYGMPSTEYVVVESATFTLNLDGAFTGSVKWHLRNNVTTDHYEWGGSVNPDGDLTTYSGQYTAACEIVNGVPEITVTTTSSKGTVRSNNYTADAPIIFRQTGATTKVLRTGLNPRVGINFGGLDLVYDR